MRLQSCRWSFLVNDENVVLRNCLICKYNKIFVGFEVLIPAVMKNSISWDITPCNPLNLFFTLTMEATFPSETSVVFQRVALLYTTDDRNLLNTIFVCFLLLAGFLNGLLIDFAPISSSETSVNFYHISSCYSYDNLESDKVLLNLVVGLPPHQMQYCLHE
jgi:hypothetical protein